MNRVIAKDMIEGRNYDTVRYVFSNRYDDESGNITYGMIFETYMLMKETNTNLIISIIYDYNDTSEYDYLSDYAKILKGLKKE